MSIVDPKTKTDWQELFEAMQLIEEMVDYLSVSSMEKIHSGSVYHQEMQNLLSNYYVKRRG